MIFAIRLSVIDSNAGTSKVSILIATFSLCPHTLGMPRSPIPTGTSRQHPSCWHMRQGALIIFRGIQHEHFKTAQLFLLATTVFRGAPDAATAGEPVYSGRLPRHFSIAAFICSSNNLGNNPAILVIEDLSAALVLDFLRYLEVERHNCARSRNARFASIRSFMEYVAFQEPSALAIVQTVLAIPMKRFEQPLIGFLSREHIEAILAAPDQNTWAGQRDRVMFTTLYNTGARASELTGMQIGDLTLDPSASVRIRGKGRKKRSLPLWRDTAVQLKCWLREYPRAPELPLFPSRSDAVPSRASV